MRDVENLYDLRGGKHCKKVIEVRAIGNFEMCVVHTDVHVRFRMGIRRSIVPWICDFLHNRQQCVRFNDVLSDYVPLHGGVPQGTKLGPIGFQILINEAAENSSSKCWK